MIWEFTRKTRMGSFNRTAIDIAHLSHPDVSRETFVRRTVRIGTDVSRETSVRENGARRRISQRGLFARNAQASLHAKAPGAANVPRALATLRLLASRYAFTAPYFERFSTSTAAIISTAPTTSAIHGLPVKPAMM